MDYVLLCIWRRLKEPWVQAEFCSWERPCLVHPVLERRFETFLNRQLKEPDIRKREQEIYRFIGSLNGYDQEAIWDRYLWRLFAIMGYCWQGQCK